MLYVFIQILAVYQLAYYKLTSSKLKSSKEIQINYQLVFLQVDVPVALLGCYLDVIPDNLTTTNKLAR